MEEQELIGKAVIAVAILLGIAFVGHFVVYIVLPIGGVALVIDLFMRSSYNAKLRAIKAEGDLVVEPTVRAFGVQIIDGLPTIGWDISLPNNAQLEIYRLTGHAGGSASDIIESGLCIHTTRTERMQAKEDFYVDYDAPGGVVHYVPIIHGKSVEQRPVEYGLFDFASTVKFTERKKSLTYRGDAVRIQNVPEAEPVLIDDRDEAEKLADDILGDILARKSLDAQLDAAIEKINANDALTDAEKREAIELLETRATAG